MLQEKDVGFVEEMKIHGVGAFLTRALLFVSRCKRSLQRDATVRDGDIENELKLALTMLWQFRLRYTSMENNVLSPEQETWQLLDPVVATCLGKFQAHLDAEPDKRGSIAPVIEEYESVIRTWNVISESYKSKEQRLHERMKETDDALTQLALRLRNDATVILAQQTTGPREE